MIYAMRYGYARVSSKVQDYAGPDGVFEQPSWARQSGGSCRITLFIERHRVNSGLSRHRCSKGTWRDVTLNRYARGVVGYSLQAAQPCPARL